MLKPNFQCDFDLAFEPNNKTVFWGTGSFSVFICLFPPSSLFVGTSTQPCAKDQHNLICILFLIFCFLITISYIFCFLIIYILFLEHVSICLPKGKKIDDKILGLPIEAQWKWIWLASMRSQVQFLTSLIGLRIQCCCELWCRSQTWLGSGVPVVQASSYSSNSSPSLRNSICHRCGPKKKQTKKKVISENFLPILD